LLMSLCLTIPAMAAFPATMEEASAMIGISTSQEFLGSVKEDFVLYDLDFDDSLYTDDQWNQRYIVRDDISLFVRNPAAETTGTNYYDEPVAWANTKQLLDGTAVPFAPANLSPRADIVTYLYRDFAE